MAVITTCLFLYYTFITFSFIYSCSMDRRFCQNRGRLDKAILFIYNYFGPIDTGGWSYYYVQCPPRKPAR